MEVTIVKKGRKGFIFPRPSFQTCKEIEKLLSYEKIGIDYMPVRSWGVVKLFRIKSCSFPWGLLDKVLPVLTKYGYDVKVKCLRKSKPDTVFAPKLRGYQKEAVKALIKNNGGVLCMPTGSGKTFTCLNFLYQYNEKSLIICPTIELVKQWQRQVPPNVDVRTYQGLKDFSILKNYEIVVFDECHHVAAASLYRIAMKLDEQIVIGLSATPYREDGEEMKMFGALGKIVYQISLRDLIDQGFLCDAVVDMSDVGHEDFDPYLSYQDIYKEYVVENVERNKMIVKKCLQYIDKKILLLVGQIDHGLKLKEMLDSKGFDSIFIHSKAKDKCVDHHVIIATSIFDEGIDLPEREVIIMAAGGKSSIKCTQRVGRVLRLHPDKDRAVVVDFFDNCKYLVNHSKRRCELYEEYGFKIRE